MKLETLTERQSLVDLVVAQCKKFFPQFDADQLAWFMAVTDAENLTQSGIKDLARMFYEGGYEQLRGNTKHMEEFIQTYTDEDGDGLPKLVAEIKDFYQK